MVIHEELGFSFLLITFFVIKCPTKSPKERMGLFFVLAHSLRAQFIMVGGKAQRVPLAVDSNAGGMRGASGPMAPCQ